MNYKAEALRLAGSRFEVFKNWVETASYNEVVKELDSRRHFNPEVPSHDPETELLRQRFLALLAEE
jgi:hypothetical protein